MPNIENITIQSKLAEQQGAPIETEKPAPEEHVILDNTKKEDRISVLHEDPPYKPKPHPLKRRRHGW